MYYEQGLSQHMIAERLRISRPTISRLLEHARKTGIVKITVQTFNSRIADLEKQLEDTFGLNEAAVISSSSTNEGDSHKMVGEVTAGILQRIVKNSDTIGISWGSSLRETVNALIPQEVPGLIIVPFVGGMGQEVRYEIQSNSLVVDAARKLGGTSYILHAQGLVGTEELKNAIMNDSGVGSVLDLAYQANIGLVGVGALNEESNLIKTGYFDMTDFNEFVKLGAVGEACGVLYDRNGVTCNIELNKRVIGLGPESLCKIETVIAAVAGEKKEEALHAALKGGFINILVTDEFTAEKVLLINNAMK